MAKISKSSKQLIAEVRRKSNARLRKFKAKTVLDPLTDSLSIAAGGAAAGALPNLVPLEFQSIAGLPTSALLGLGLVVYASTGKSGKQTKIAAQLGQGMLAVYAAQIASQYSA